MVTRVTIKVRPNAAFKTHEDRQRFAAFVGDILAAGQTRKFTPTELNDGRNKGREWSVADNNDWWVFFDEKDTTQVTIQQRYGVMEALGPLCDYVAYCWRGQVIQPEAVPA